MKEKALKQLDNTSQQLLNVLSGFSPAQLNTVPFEGSWTPAQVADHILKSQSGVPELFDGSIMPADRLPDQKIQALRELFLNFSYKMKSPDFILPTNNNLEKNALIDQIKEKSKQIEEAIIKYDLTEICLDFELPGFGTLTRLELIYFIFFHTQRHIYQLETIYQKFNN
ncbi:DinB family protein [Pedobacter metabolipauper]|uniref:DinB family protein n=1 Tax=Pedobacter metabolipauper TaxID=425513 RepID=A0A4R6STU4_9SPHI|nr:DinB family protein [Pedobacter metabolipauper]TDQ08190.1 DinB family protein [Pedobacter metabolipauper]